ncbi:anaerobic ribonucleoside-triphosphate reductase activating protein [Vallitalea sp.]|jgi:pyruvate formate lyase activating enzyme|uniref:anaerobic ribonucleoside-triphosphate reductase activating protein n=1 Tax=Vallitalea sp. TaxID=1882829 RepID=UPI0025F3D104|nr:anaerobic ribonucleoside-triphosphate reductase activating protein [Vallitalea sp.]MCT4687639.1 anaerobic ribonucleoside-triphosphate reductase activating protein [Vallitalea sp.]
MNIKGFTKTTLLDYPGHIASTIFTGGCNFNCPYCHNGDLVIAHKDMDNITEQSVLAHIKKRCGIINNICISGGEPTLQPDLISFLRKIKEYSIKIKLDTNGTNPSVIKSAYENDLIDYIALDIKNSKNKYALTCDRKINITDIEKSVNYIKTCGIDYEFRTTVIKEFHTIDDIVSIGDWLNGSKRFYIQQYVESDKQIKQGFHAYSHKTLMNFKNHVEPYFESVSIRGVG